MEIVKAYIIDTKVYLQLPPVLLGLYYWRHLDKEYKLFVGLLIYTVFNELFKLYYGTHISLGKNLILTNIYNIIYFNFIFWIFYKRSENKRFRKVVITFCILYFLSIGYELGIKKLNYFEQTQVIPYIIGGIGVLVCVANYLISILTSAEYKNVYRDLLLWIAIAHFIYYLGFTPFKVGENYFASFEEFHHLFNLKIIITVLKSIILSIGFICSRQRIQ